MIDAERDAWILVAAQLPQHMPFYMEMKQRQLDDPAVLELYRDLADAIHWQPDDVRVEMLADRLVGLLEAGESEAADDRYGESKGADDGYGEISDDLAALLDSVFLDSVPIARRLMFLLEQRGWTGWTKNQRVPASSRSAGKPALPGS